jgi:hypothetical protein
VRDYANYDLVQLFLFKLPWLCYSLKDPSQSRDPTDALAVIYNRTCAPSKVHGRLFGLYEKLGMAVFPLAVPYVHRVIKHIFSHIGVEL